MRLHELFWFFLGDAEAIRSLAANRWSLAAGALLVLTAGLARNYDTQDVRRQWWRLLIPFAASTLAAAVLVLVIMLVTGSAALWLEQARGILGLFWLTAPLAWLYGIPYERIWPPALAVRNRRLALGAVALCRVVLMTRCVSVLCGCSLGQAFLMVLCFAVPTAVLAVGAALAAVRRPETRSIAEPAAAPETSGAAAVRVVVDGMSGHPFVVDSRGEFRTDVMAQGPGADAPRPPPGTPKLEREDDEFAGVALGGCGAFLLVLSSCGLLKFLERLGGAWQPRALVPSAAPPSPELWIFATGAVLFWSVALIVRQPAQRRRTHFAQRLRSDRLAVTIRDLARHRAEEFPPGWDPSAALAYPDAAPRLLDACSIAAGLPADSWVRGRFLERLRNSLPLWIYWYDLHTVQDGKPGEPLREPGRLHDLTRLRDLLRSLPEAVEILERYQVYLAHVWELAEKRDPPRGEIIRDIYLLATKRGCRR